jgi:hypothetical protein
VIVGEIHSDLVKGSTADLKRLFGDFKSNSPHRPEPAFHDACHKSFRELRVELLRPGRLLATGSANLDQPQSEDGSLDGQGRSL